MIQSVSYSRSGWTLGNPSFNHFPGDANTAGPVMTLGEPLTYARRQLPQKLKQHF